MIKNHSHLLVTKRDENNGHSLFHWLVAELHKGSDCRGGGIEQIHLVLLDHLPVASIVGVEGRALKLQHKTI
jgi:hypothetical protein